MKTVIVGGGQGCQAVLEMVVQNRLAVLSPEVMGVVDPNPRAPGMVFALEHGWPVFSNIEDALSLSGLELIIEVTGIEAVHEEIARLVSGRARIMDHKMARVFWDLDEMSQDLRHQLAEKTALEIKIREDRRQLQLLLDSLPDSVMVLNRNGVIERVNRRFEEITHLSCREVQGMKCSDLCQPNGERESYADKCPGMRALEVGSPVMVVRGNNCIWGINKKEERFHQTVANPICNSSGEQSVVVTSREVTEQIQLARETEEHARRARQILSAVRAIITITDLEGRFQFVNPSAEKLFGISAEEAEGKTIDDLLPKGVAKVIKKNDEAVLRDTIDLSHEETLFLDGKEHILITERVLLHDYKNEPNALCRVSRDVTTSRKLHQELLESEKHAAVGKLAAGVAHELNNPLTGILSFSEDLLEDMPEDSAAHDDIKIIMREALRCRQLVRDLLDFSRQGKTNRTMITLEPVVKRSIKLVEKQAAFHDIDIALDSRDDSIRAYADPNQLQQIILNLIINARDAMNGKGYICVALEKEPGNGGASISVADNGCGISPEIMNRIFEPFFSTKGVRGNGLGLAAVRNIVEEHGGAVTVESEPGAGSTFKISLPAVNRAEETTGGRPVSVVPAYHDWAEN